MSLFSFGFNIGRVKKSGGGASYDADAQAFFTAAGITNTTQKSAVNQLVLDLKSYNIWTKMKAVYPIVGGSASSHAVNLKIPGTYNLSFSTGWTHSSNGMTPTSAYANTNLNMSSNYSVNDNLHISFYSRTSTDLPSNYEMGVFNGSSITGLFVRKSGTSYFASNFSSYITYVDANAAAFYISNRLGTSMKGWRNNVNVASNTSTATGRQNLNMFIGTLNNNGNPDSGLYTSRQFAFSSIGDGLTDTEASNFYTAVQNYQTTLGRNV